MTWEYAIPAVGPDEIAQSAESLMDEEAFAGFYRRTASALWAYLARVSGDRSLADDLLQESYLRFLRSGHRAGADTADRSYLFRIASNLLKDRWRHDRVARMSALEDVREADLPVVHNRQPDVLAAAVLVGCAFQRMRPRERQLLWLAYAEEATHREIAGVMGLHPASVRLLLFRARRKLARMLGERHEGSNVRTP
jgi:RNA polymerase sigma-70 factor (ECF subfamily)